MILQECELRLSWRGPLMCMRLTMLQSRPSLRLSLIADFRLAASKMTGPKRRAFEAEMTIKYGEGTPLTAQAALNALTEQGYREDQLPSPTTMAEVLNRMGFRLRKVVKAQPQKKLKETDAIFDNIKKKMTMRCHRKVSNAGVSIGKRP